MSGEIQNPDSNAIIKKLTAIIKVNDVDRICSTGASSYALVVCSHQGVKLIGMGFELLFNQKNPTELYCLYYCIRPTA